jgi:hypothetical protein
MICTNNTNIIKAIMWDKGCNYTEAKKISETLNTSTKTEILKTYISQCKMAFYND